VHASEKAGTFHYIGEPERKSVTITFSQDGLLLAHTCRGYVKRGELLFLVAQDIYAN
jgi:predicted deacylase